MRQLLSIKALTSKEVVLIASLAVFWLAVSVTDTAALETGEGLLELRARLAPGAGVFEVLLVACLYSAVRVVQVAMTLSAASGKPKPRGVDILMRGTSAVLQTAALYGFYGLSGVHSAPAAATAMVFIAITLVAVGVLWSLGEALG